VAEDNWSWRQCNYDGECYNGIVCVNREWWCIRDVLLFAFGHSNLRVPTEAADEDELGQIGGAGGGGRKGLYRCEDVKKKSCRERTHASKAGAWLAEEGEHDRRVQEWMSRGVTRCGPPLGLPLATCLNKPLQYPFNHHSQDYRKTLRFRHV
jgi:hypothetical protein